MSDENQKELASSTDYKKWLDIYNEEQKKKQEQERKIDKEFTEYNENIEQLDALKKIVKKRKLEFLGLSDMDKFVLKNRRNQEKG